MAITKGSPVTFTAANDTEITTYEPNFQLIEGSLGLMLVESNEFAPRYGTSGTTCSYRDNVNTYTQDQEAQAKLSNALGGGYMGLLLRAGPGVGAASNFYRGSYSGSDGGRLDIWKIVNGTPTVVATVTSTPFVNNDVLKFRATGGSSTVLGLYKNNSTTPLLTFADSTSPHTGGSPGISGRAAGGFEWAMDDWTPNDYVFLSDLSGTTTLDDVVASGSISSGGTSGDLSGTVTLDDVVASGALAGGAPGTVATGVWRNDAGMPLPSETIPRITFQRLTDGVQVLTLTGQVTTSSPTAPTLTITNAALVIGTQYLVISNNADGSALGVELATAS